MNTFWLSPEILNWKIVVHDCGLHGESSWKRAYDIWRHAEQILLEKGDPFFRVDVITTLKRAINHRLQYLDRIYKFRKIPTRDKSRGLLEQLSDLGIVKPIMLKRLMAIRNKIEHQDATPPSKSRCKEFLEFTWYFLRSTDKIAGIDRLLFKFAPEDHQGSQPYYVFVSTDPEEEWIINLYGWLQPTFLVNKEKDGWLKINAQEIFSRTAYYERYHYLNESSGCGKEPNDIQFHGTLLASKEQQHKIYQLWFALLSEQIRVA